MARILLADDDHAMREFIQKSLENAGHSVSSHEDGLKAFEDLTNTLQSPQAYDLLLTDIVMPGMDGLELAKKAEGLQPDLKILFITGFAGMAPKVEHATVLPKPFHLNDLIKHVETLLDQ